MVDDVFKPHSCAAVTTSIHLQSARASASKALCLPSCSRRKGTRAPNNTSTRSSRDNFRETRRLLRRDNSEKCVLSLSSARPRLASRSRVGLSRAVAGRRRRESPPTCLAERRFLERKPRREREREEVRARLTCAPLSARSGQRPDAGRFELAHELFDVAACTRESLAILTSAHTPKTTHSPESSGSVSALSGETRSLSLSLSQE